MVGCQVMVPGRPTLSLTAVWALPFDPLNDFADDTPFVRNLRTFLEGDDAERSTIFKLIPRCHQSPSPPPSPPAPPLPRTMPRPAPPRPPL